MAFTLECTARIVPAGASTTDIELCDIQKGIHLKVSFSFKDMSCIRKPHRCLHVTNKTSFRQHDFIDQYPKLLYPSWI